jgi:hypothetical protein
MGRDLSVWKIGEICEVRMRALRGRKRGEPVQLSLQIAEPAPSATSPPRAPVQTLLLRQLR